MIYPTWSSLFDIVLLGVITFTAYDALRQTHFFAQPVRGLTFAFICVGAFGWIMYDLQRNVIPWWVLVFHIGIASHSVLRFIARNRSEVHYVGSFNHHRHVAAQSLRGQAQRTSAPGPKRR